MSSSNSLWSRLGSVEEHQDPDVGDKARHQEPEVGEELAPGAVVILSGTTYLQVERLLGEPGGFGHVYEVQAIGAASTLCLPSRLALKVPKPEKTMNSILIEGTVAINMQALTREMNEWKGRVFIPSVFALGEAVLPGSAVQRPVLLMEAADGTLRSLVQEKALSGDALQCIAWALATTLAHLHKDGCVHGDLKPSNVLFRKRRSQSSGVLSILGGWPLLADFGSAQDPQTFIPRRAIHWDEEVRTLCWSPSYAAPEVHTAVKAGRGIIQTARSDMFAWAMTVDAVIKAARQHGTVKLSQPMQEIISRCLSPRPEDRPASFGVIAASLETSMCQKWAAEFWHEQQKDLAELPTTALRHSLEYLVHAAEMMMDTQDPRVATRTLRFLAGQRQLLGDNLSEVQALLQNVLDKQVSDGENYLELAQTSIELGGACANDGEMSKSLGHYRTAYALLQLCPSVEAVGVREQLLGVAMVGLAGQYIWLANSQNDQTLYKESINLCQQALQVHPRDRKDETVAHTKVVLAQAYLFAGKRLESLEIFQEAVDTLQALLGEPHPSIAKAKYNMADAYLQLDDPESMFLFREALEMDGNYYGDASLDVAHDLVALGKAGCHFGKRDKNLRYIEEGIALLEEAMEIRTSELAPNHPDRAEVEDALKRAQMVREEMASPVMPVGQLGYEDPKTAAFYDRLLASFREASFREVMAQVLVGATVQPAQCSEFPT